MGRADKFAAPSQIDFLPATKCLSVIEFSSPYLRCWFISFSLQSIFNRKNKEKKKKKHTKKTHCISPDCNAAKWRSFIIAYC